MANFINYISNFFLISLAITFILIMFLIYHYKQRISLLEQEVEKMLGIVRSVATELDKTKKHVQQIADFSSPMPTKPMVIVKEEDEHEHDSVSEDESESESESEHDSESVETNDCDDDGDDDESRHSTSSSDYKNIHIGNQIESDVVELENIDTVIDVIHEDIPIVHEDLPIVHDVQDLPIISQDISQDLPIVHEDLPIVHDVQELPIISQDLPIISQDLPIVHEDLPIVHEDLPIVHDVQDLPIVHEDLPIVHEPIVHEEDDNKTEATEITTVIDHEKPYYKQSMSELKRQVLQRYPTIDVSKLKKNELIKLLSA